MIGTMMGPAPCSECHARLYLRFVGGAAGWYERILHSGRGQPTYRKHRCTARSGNPLLHGEGHGFASMGGHHRTLVGLPRKRRAPKGKIELV